MSSAGSVELNSVWLRGSGEWRPQWFVGGLSPGTNCTAYVIQDQVKVSGPIYFVTKSSYAVPLLPRQSPALAYDATSFPTNISDPLLQYMTNFTTMLLTFGCGRDLYPPFQTCSDCRREYRSWLYRSNAQAPFSALQPQPSGVSPRNSFLPVVNYTYTSLLPCLEVCHAVDRACPYFLGISFPVPQFNADASYGVGFIDGGDPGVSLLGVTLCEFGGLLSPNLRTFAVPDEERARPEMIPGAMFTSNTRSSSVCDFLTYGANDITVLLTTLGARFHEKAKTDMNPHLVPMFNVVLPPMSGPTNHVEMCTGALASGEVMGRSAFLSSINDSHWAARSSEFPGTVVRGVEVQSPT
ncbi:stretch-activated Ca2+-permeable channel component-domain-containing protein [Pisolithus thermaeus]|nr:stretch-activated Ca2+-permeable channel component-domain-containing protein [Pisolithus thermaeus]